MAIAANLGYPRLGRRRELKSALEAYWSARVDEQALLDVAKNVRREAWLTQRDAGIDRVPSNDFSLYDHVLDAAVALGAIPARYQVDDELSAYFAMARGDQRAGRDVAALEMTKWFDTNYHFIVPELETPFSARADARKPLAEFAQAKALGITTIPVLVGPLSFILLTRHVDGASAFAAMDTVVAAYGTLLKRLAEAGVPRVQLDEPCLVLDLNDQALLAYRRAYAALAQAAPGLPITLATYFGPLPERAIPVALALPIDTLHLDMTRGPQPMDEILRRLPTEILLSLGVVDGRNIWRNDLAQTLTLLEPIAERIGTERTIVAPSCSLLHVPYDLDDESGLDPELTSWLAFGKEKLREVRALADGINKGREAIGSLIAQSTQAALARRRSARVHDPAVAYRLENVIASSFTRAQPFKARHIAQREHLGLPAFPTTTIGSFPQTKEVRKARADFRAARMGEEAYHAFLREEIERTIRMQEAIGLDVLVHGEFERNDMVEYFGEQLEGFAFTKYGWVQSYGSRCVKPPIIFGDVSRTRPMTVQWSAFAQSLTNRPVKGMLTGPVTILQWSFVRDDQPRETTAKQIALAVRDEVADLEAAGISIIQIDEPALREGLPLRERERADYLRWAVQAFGFASSGVNQRTQIHTHMCYADFNDILEAIIALDADVISIEASRSNFALLEALVGKQYPNDIGPGVYDIHSPRVPTATEISALLDRLVAHVPVERVWVNPDCGLKTRDWTETEGSLRAMVEAARIMRALVGTERFTAEKRSK